MPQPSESTSLQSPQRIAIVGGGMVGISLAIMLANALPDCAISLIEKFPFQTPPSSSGDESLQSAHFTPSSQPSFDARSTALSAGSVQLLNAIHCWDLLQAHAEPISTIHISDRGHYGSTLLHAKDYGVDGIEGLGYVIENRILGEALLQRLQQTHVRCITPATVERCELTQQEAILHLSQQDELNALGLSELAVDLVLIADGTDSPLGQSLGIDSDIKQYQQSAIITNIALSQAHKGIAYERFTDQGPLAVLPLPNYDGMHRASVVWTRNSDQVDALLQADDADFIQQLQTCFGFRAAHIQQVGKKQVYPLQLVQAKEQIRSRIVVLGNAAHFLHPVAGQGFNLSLRDCATLASVLQTAAQQRQALGEYRVLKGYMAQRERDQQTTIALTDTMVKTFSSSQLSLSVMRQCGLLSLHALPTAKKILARQMMGVSS